MQIEVVVGANLSRTELTNLQYPLALITTASHGTVLLAYDILDSSEYGRISARHIVRGHRRCEAISHELPIRARTARNHHNSPARSCASRIRYIRSQRVWWKWCEAHCSRSSSVRSDLARATNLCEKSSQSSQQPRTELWVSRTIYSTAIIMVELVRGTMFEVIVGARPSRTGWQPCPYTPRTQYSNDLDVCPSRVQYSQYQRSI